MTTYYYLKDTDIDENGRGTFPEGCTHAWAENLPGLTSLTLPEGCTDAWAVNLPGLTSLTFPEGCTYARAGNLPGLTSLTFSEGCAYAWAVNLPQLKRIHAPDDVEVYLDGKPIAPDHPPRKGGAA